MYVFEHLPEKPDPVSDWYNLNTGIAEYVIPRLKHFIAESVGGFPVCGAFTRFNKWWEGEGDAEMENIFLSRLWNEYLRRILWSFEYSLHEDDDYMPRFDTLEHRMMERRYEEGMALFAKYFRNLWD